MGDRSSVTRTVFGKIRGFSMVSGDKNTDQNAHKMVHDPVRIDLHKFNFLNWLYMNGE